tara:strand:+ start:331 stop:894 length:564 start_codon:yes stop_codon:yes gene_type:complete
MKVYYAPQSRAVRTVWLLEEIGLGYELEKFTLGQKEMRGPEYTSVNPNGRVPTLIDGDVTLTESTAIAQYLGAKYAPALIPETDAGNFAQYLQWLHYAEGMIMGPMGNYVVETVLLPPERRNPELAMRALKLMGRTLARWRPIWMDVRFWPAVLPSPILSQDMQSLWLGVLRLILTGSPLFQPTRTG